MKKIITNPKILVWLTNILLVISFVSINILMYGNLKIDKLFSSIIDYAEFGSLIALVYFLIIGFKKHINLKLLNTILFINYVLVIIIRIGYIFYTYKNYAFSLLFSSKVLFTSYIIFFTILIVFLSMIFYFKNKKNIKPNLMTIICIITYVICLISSIYNVQTYGITKFEVAINWCLSTLYLIPMILYFRLYALNKFKKMEERNER